jgi:hypothetical protein
LYFDRIGGERNPALRRRRQVQLASVEPLFFKSLIDHDCAAPIMPARMKLRWPPSCK